MGRNTMGIAGTYDCDSGFTHWLKIPYITYTENAG